MSARRWSKFWWQDWQRDPALRMCSPASRGIWMDMLCIMSDAIPVGHLLVNGRQPTPRQLSNVFGISEKETVALITELEQSGVFSRTDDGTITSRRMIRDAEASDTGRKYVEKRWNGDKGNDGEPNGGGGSPPNRGSNGPTHRGASGNPNTLEAEAEAEERKDPPSAPQTDLPITAPPLASPDGRRGPRGSRLPPDWQPTPIDRDFAVGLGLQPDRIACSFRDFWHAKAGLGATKLDWSATWRNWCRNEADRPRQSAPKPLESKGERLRRQLGLGEELDAMFSDERRLLQ